MNKTELKKRFVIGSANFTQKYGADPLKLNFKQANEILDYATKIGINKIDTAEAYFKKSNLFSNINHKLKFFTKIMPNKKWNSLEYCQKKLENHFKTFKTNQVETLYFHDTKVLFSKNGIQVFKNLELLKKKGYFQKIGLSIYNTESLDFISSNYNFDAIQFPYNILDDRILASGWYDKLKNLDIELHARSIFLQGLLVNNLIYKKKYFQKWDFLSKWFNFFKNKNISPIDYCLSDLLNLDFDQIIIGLNNCANLRQIINFHKVKKNIKIERYKTHDLRLIDPRNWN